MKSVKGYGEIANNNFTKLTILSKDEEDCNNNNVH